jgi:hypothetical protein
VCARARARACVLAGARARARVYLFAGSCLRSCVRVCVCTRAFARLRMSDGCKLACVCVRMCMLESVRACVRRNGPPASVVASAHWVACCFCAADAASDRGRWQGWKRPRNSSRNPDIVPVRICDDEAGCAGCTSSSASSMIMFPSAHVKKAFEERVLHRSGQPGTSPWKSCVQWFLMNVDS